MTTKIVPGSLVAVRTPGDVAREASLRAARVLREAVTERGSATVALSGGFTPKETYARLATEAVDWMKVQVFLVDDRAVPPDRERSNYRMIRETLLDPAKVPAANVHRMATESSDLEASARA
jgi:6-phosphogluconolactonase